MVVAAVATTVHLAKAAVVFWRKTRTMLQLSLSTKNQVKKRAKRNQRIMSASLRKAVKILQVFLRRTRITIAPLTKPKRLDQHQIKIKTTAALAVALTKLKTTEVALTEARTQVDRLTK